MRRISVVIPNYNYDEFVAEAIESALAVDWPDVEVIVVDDGSTDRSREVIARYVDRITVLEQDNAGQRVACNAGFARSTGDVVIFLDSDDVLAPQVAHEIEAVLTPAVSKIQWQMQRVDRDGNPSGAPFPHFAHVPTSFEVRDWMTETSAYPTPPGSGNAYARWFLEKIFPLDARCGEASDSACLAAAPLLGDVVTIDRPLASYRIHGGNDSAFLVDPQVKLPRQIDVALRRHLYARELSGRSDDLRPLFRGRHLLQLRIAERRTNPDRQRPIPTDGWWRMLGNSLTSAFPPGPESVLLRIGVTGWSLATLLAPRPLAEALIRRRFEFGRPAVNASPAAVRG